MFIAEKKARGFSLVELVTVLIIIGVLAASSTSLFIPSSTFQMQAARDQVVAAFAAAQQRAMSRTNAIQVSTSGNQIDVREDIDGDGNFATSVSVSMGGVQYPLALLANQTISNASFTFNRLGETNSGTLTLSQSGASVAIEVTDSGYAY